VRATLGPELVKAACYYARADKAAATRRAYKSDFELFRSWCETKCVLALPATMRGLNSMMGLALERLLLAQSRHVRLPAKFPLSRVKRNWPKAVTMSASASKLTCQNRSIR
jgi:hypothetical protein